MSERPVVLPIRMPGRPFVLQTWDAVTPGATNPREDGAGNLEAGGDFEDGRNGSICVSLRTYGTPVNDRGRETSVPFGMGVSEDEDFLPTLRVEEDALLGSLVGSQNVPVAETDNPNESTPPTHTRPPRPFSFQSTCSAIFGL